MLQQHPGPGEIPSTTPPEFTPLEEPMTPEIPDEDDPTKEEPEIPADPTPEREIPNPPKES
ncbi:MAG: hypothetical protein ACXWV5_04290 [Flavitalea sp.]